MAAESLHDEPVIVPRRSRAHLACLGDSHIGSRARLPPQHRRPQAGVGGADADVTLSASASTCIRLG
jgi:hypothetical protein